MTDFDFRKDGAAALDWAAGYLEHLDERPVLARVKPGELSAQLQLSPPDQLERFANVRDELDDPILRALTN